MLKKLGEQEIQTLIHYPIPPNKQQAYREWNSLTYALTNLLHQEVLSLPISSSISEEQAGMVVAAVNNFKE
jgi:dTDP-4-amino-4,6-dideoxygalactose transaminase